MAVVTIDAKGELAELQAMQNIQDAPATGDTPAPSKPTEEPAPTQKAPIEDPDDIEGEDGLTPRQKRDFTQAMQRTIGKKHRERREAEEFAAAQYAERQLAEGRAAAAERELADLKAKAQPVPRETAQPDPEAGKPTRDKFDSDQTYWDAYVDWRAERKADAKIKEKEAKDAADRAAQERGEVEAAATARVSKAVKLVPDFQQKVLDQADDIVIPSAITGYLERSPLMPEIVYHLVTHPDVLEALFKLSPEEQLVTIGEIKGTLKPFESRGSKAAQTDGAKPSDTAVNGHTAEPSETGSTPSRPRSSAPVITPLNGNSGAVVTKDPGDMNIRETIVDWQKRNKANLGLRKRH